MNPKGKHSYSRRRTNQTIYSEHSCGQLSNDGLGHLYDNEPFTEDDYTSNA